MSDWIWFIYVTALDSKFPGCLSFFFFVAVFSPDHYQGSWGALHHSHTHTWLEGLHTGEVTGYNINNSTQLPKDSKKPTYHRASLTNTDDNDDANSTSTGNCAPQSRREQETHSAWKTPGADHMASATRQHTFTKECALFDLKWKSM